MIFVENETVCDIPVLHVAGQAEWQERLPLVIFLHGFMSVKERNLQYAYLLAKAGFRVILPEAKYHGERDQGLAPKEFYLHFWEIVLNTIREVSTVKEYYEEKGLINPEQIGVAGTSMGGIITLGALTQYEWIKSAVSLMGMPSYQKFSLWQMEQFKNQGINLPFTKEEIDQQLRVLREYDLSTQPEKLADRPLLFWHGKKDPVVPYPLTYQFYEAAKRQYQHCAERLRFITDEGAGHKVSIAGVEAAVHWFEKHLLAI